MVKSKRFGLAFMACLTMALAMVCSFPASAEVVAAPAYVQVDTAPSVDAVDAVKAPAVESELKNLVAPGIITCRPGPVPGSPTGPRLCNQVDKDSLADPTVNGNQVASTERYDKSFSS